MTDEDKKCEDCLFYENQEHCCFCEHKYWFEPKNEIKLEQLEKENEELKAYIEGMKMVASSWIMSLEDIRASEVNNRRLEVLRELEKRINEELAG